MSTETKVLPMYDPQKRDLPKRRDYVGTLSWLRAVRDCIGQPVVFALDEALMCQGNFGGRSDEYLVWVYGADSVTKFNGVRKMCSTKMVCRLRASTGRSRTHLPMSPFWICRVLRKLSADITMRMETALRESSSFRGIRSGLRSWRLRLWHITRMILR